MVREAKGFDRWSNVPRAVRDLDFHRLGLSAQLCIGNLAVDIFHQFFGRLKRLSHVNGKLMEVGTVGSEQKRKRRLRGAYRKRDLESTDSPIKEVEKDSSGEIQSGLRGNGQQNDATFFEPRRPHFSNEIGHKLSVERFQSDEDSVGSDGEFGDFSGEHCKGS